LALRATFPQGEGYNKVELFLNSSFVTAVWAATPSPAGEGYNKELIILK
jgi:hypothetical protein